MIRRRLTPLQRLRIAYEQKYLCNQCKILLEPIFHIDHKVALSQGGSNNLYNLQALCLNCHINKTRHESSGGTSRECYTCGVVFSMYFEHDCNDAIEY